MGLSEDQRALLRLLAQREQGYEDIAALMGLSVEEVRARVKEALEAVESAESAAEAPAQGDAKPTGQRAERLSPPSPPKDAVPAGKPPAAEEERPPAPGPEPVEPPFAGQRTPPAAGIKRPSERRRGRLPKERRVYAIAAGLGAIAVVIVLLASGAIGGGDDSGSDGGASDNGSAAAGAEQLPTAAQLANAKLTGAVLEPPDGGDARGAALFGRQRRQVLLQVEATGLEPSPPGSSYTIWFYKSPELALRVGAVKVDESGGIRAQLPIPLELLAYLSSGVFNQLDVALTSDAAYNAEVRRARKAKRLPAYSGESVLRGEIVGPIIEAKAGGGGKDQNKG